ncbi:MAG: hypothetical protein HKO66_16910 [Saprospiraceae bacterium]|nr:hypothetical protein [Bacteroidia bacterium]NNE16339.1 hypothetical protein [Saprospiraceae bacterium]NNL93927.1 hypothetical protein [Saprospiraceae bacterium]
MKIEKKDLNALTAELTIVIEKDDYLSDFNQQIKTYQQKSAMKGFRKGKTPIGLVKKMYGSAALQESVSKILSNKINEIISGEEYQIIGEPLFLDEDNLPTIDYTDPQDYSYRFEIGLEPEFDVQGASETDTYSQYKVDISDEMIDEEVAEMCKKFGNQIEVDDTIVENDVVYVKVSELEGKNIKEGGVESEFSFNIDKVEEAYQESILKMKKGDSFDMNIFKFEKDLPEDNVYKYLLKIDKPAEEDAQISEMFKAEITKVVRNEPSEFNQELFDKYFGKDAVKSEDEAREKIKSFIDDYFTTETVNYLNREIMEALVAKNQFDLPEGFIKKWINKEKEMPEDQFENFIKEMKWRVIKKKLVKQFEVNVEEQEILNYFVNMIRNYSPYIDEATLKNTAFSLMKNREQVNSAIEAVSSGKLFDEVRKVVKIESEDIDKDGFTEKVKEINKRMQ